MPERDRGSTSVIVDRWFNFTLLPQQVIPFCEPPAPECELAIVDITTTAASERGTADGSIAIQISGITTGETVTYYINGVAYITGTTATTHTVTGLTSGVYQVYILDTAGCFVTEDAVILDGEFRTGNFIVQSPTNLTAVENPIIIGVGTAINSSSPRRNITTLDVVGDLTDGFNIRINLTSPYLYSQTFYSKAYPNKTNFFLASVLNNSVGIPVGTNTHTEIATSLAESLQKDTLIPRVYFINNDGTTVTLEAKETGDRFDLTSSNMIASATGVTVTQTQAGRNFCDGQISDNYSISCEVMVNTNETNQYPELGDDIDYNRVAELILPFNPNNIHRFDISSILKNQVSTPMPDTTLTGSTLLPTIMQPFYCKLSELYPLVPNTNTIKKRYKTTVPVQWTINSSLDRYSPNIMDDYLGIISSNIDADFGLDMSWSTTGTVEFTDYLFELTGNTGTTNVMFSIWNNTNTGVTYNWQTGDTFTGVTAGEYFAHISGTTDGIIHQYFKSFFINQFSNDYDDTRKRNVRTDVKFLTNSPSPKQIERQSNEFLYFILPKNYGKELKVKGDLYFYDGTEVTGQTFFTISTGTTNAGGCMIMNLSYDKLGLENYEVTGTTNRKIKRAELAVYQSDSVNGDWQYTEEKIYRFEIDEMPRKWGVLFQNGLGTFDSYDFVGVVEETVSRDADTYTIPLTFNINGSLASGFKSTATYNTRIIKRVTANTGWVNQVHFDWLMELIKSNNVFSTATANQNYVNLIEYSYKKSSLDDLFDVECVFEWTIFQNNITI